MQFAFKNNINLYYFEHQLPIDILFMNPNLTPQAWMQEWSEPKNLSLEFQPLKLIMNQRGIQLVGSNQSSNTVNNFMATSIAGDLQLFTFDGQMVQLKSNKLGHLVQHYFCN